MFGQQVKLRRGKYVLTVQSKLSISVNLLRDVAKWQLTKHTLIGDALDAVPQTNWEGSD
jgi:hypothetical protein